MGKKWKQWQILFSWAPKSLWTVTIATILKDACSLGKKAMINPDSVLKSRHTFANKGPCSQRYYFSSSHLQMWELDHKEGLVPKNRCFQTAVLEKTLESPLDSKEIKSINANGNQPQIFIRRTDAEAEAPILWPPDVKNQLIRKGPDAGKDWKQEDKGATKNEVVGWYHRLKGHEFEQTGGDSKRKGSLACCSPWGCKESDMT